MQHIESKQAPRVKHLGTVAQNWQCEASKLTADEAIFVYCRREKWCRRADSELGLRFLQGRGTLGRYGLFDSTNGQVLHHHLVGHAMRHWGTLQCNPRDVNHLG